MACEDLEKIAHLAGLSDDVYNDSPNLDKDLEEKGIKPFKDFQLGDYSPTGYFGRAYINDKTREVVIAHRGTEVKAGDFLNMAKPDSNPLKKLLENQTLKDLFLSDATIAITGINPQTAESMLFTQSVMEGMAESGRSGYTIVQTGHSLGGGNATINAAFFGQKAITFDSYGVKTQLDLYKRLNIISPEEYQRALGNSINYGASGGLVKDAFDLGPGRFGLQVEIDGIDTHSMAAYKKHFQQLYQDCLKKHGKEPRSASNSASSPIATVGDYHTCPAYNGDTAHVGGKVIGGSPNVFINGKPAARKSDPLSCDGVGQTTDRIIGGSNKTFINGLPAARLNDPTAHGGVILGSGSGNVITQ